MPLELIAHRANDPEMAQKAFDAGFQKCEVDIAKRFKGRFVLQHQGIKGVLGIGSKVEILKFYKGKLLADLKHTKFSPGFAPRFIEQFNQLDLPGIQLCGFDWKDISDISETGDYESFYTLGRSSDFDLLYNSLPYLNPPAGLSVRHTLLTPERITELSGKVPTSNGAPLEIMAWRVNDVTRAHQLHEWGVRGFITDNYEEMAAEFAAQNFPIK